VDAGQDLHQRRLAGPVLADQRDDFSALDGEVDLVQRDDAGKAFADRLHLEYRIPRQ
jgi:hypothetical protein